MNSTLDLCCRHLFPSIVCSTKSSACHLTFDDGPHPVVTPRVLHILQSFNARATFFVLGKRAEEHPRLIHDILDGGHAIGNHAYDHGVLLFRPRVYIQEQIGRAAESIRRISGVRPTLFRPPFGLFNPSTVSAAAELDHRLVLWSVNPADYSRRTPERMASILRRRTKSGSIVLLHDSDLTIDTAEPILTAFFEAPESSKLTFAPVPS